MTRYWIGVASYAHVKAGVAGGFAQLGHGKRAPVRNLHSGDWVIYYSPKTAMIGGEPVQAFTAIGKVKPRAAYQSKQARDFHPYRRDVDYRHSARPAKIAELLERLSFTCDRGPYWGLVFRRTSFEMSRNDFALIAKAMKIEPPEEASKAC